MLSKENLEFIHETLKECYEDKKSFNSFTSWGQPAQIADALETLKSEIDCFGEDDKLGNLSHIAFSRGLEIKELIATNESYQALIDLLLYFCNHQDFLGLFNITLLDPHILHYIFYGKLLKDIDTEKALDALTEISQTFHKGDKND